MSSKQINFNLNQFDGLKLQRENYKALKEEIMNIKNNIDKEINNSLNLNSKIGKIRWRGRIKEKIILSPSEEKFNLNGLIKLAEQNKNQYDQGFTSKYFLKLSDLMSDSKFINYPKERLILFKERLQDSWKKYISNLTKKPEKMNSINYQIKNANSRPFVTNLHSYTNNNRMSFMKRKIGQGFICPLLYKNKNLSYNFTNKKEDNTISYNNIFIPKLGLKKNNFWRRGNQNSNNLCVILSGRKINEKSESMNFSNVDGQKEFLDNLDRDQFFAFLKTKNNFYNKRKDRRKLKFEIKEKIRQNMFKESPNEDFLDKEKKNYRLYFFSKVRRNIDNENSGLLHVSEDRKKIKEPSSCDKKEIKTIKFNKECKSIYEKFKNNLNI